MLKNKREKLNKKDVGLIDDAIFTVKNLSAWEDHLTTQIAKMKNEKDKEKFSNILERVRERRSLIMELIVKENAQYSEWCQTKHGCNSSMGLLEIGNRFLNMNDKKKAMRCFNESLECVNDIFEINDIPHLQKEAITEA